ncbi:hypothetical protein ACPXCD_33770, partial [Micromonospora zamorensis]
AATEATLTGSAAVTRPTRPVTAAETTFTAVTATEAALTRSAGTRTVAVAATETTLTAVTATEATVAVAATEA